MTTLANKPWSNRKSLLKQLEKLWDSGVLLQQLITPTALFPKRLTFKPPGSKALSDEFALVRDWITEIQQLNGFRVEYKTVRHRIIGENSLPCEVWVDNLPSAISLLKRAREMADFTRLIEQSQQQLPVSVEWLAHAPLKALTLADVWPKLLALVCWRQQHPAPGIYLRQVNLPGIDSKFIEQHRSVLSQLLDLTLPSVQINHNMSGVKQFAQRYGFQNKPERIRFRLLAPTLQLLPGDDGDITLSASDFQALEKNHAFSQQLKRVYITENEINFLAFPPQKNSLVIFGAGYGFEALAEVDWLKQREVIYWGDIDTHGFAILDQLRSKLPHVKSLLMDQQTLIDHQIFWGEESKPEYKALSRLSPQEQLLYQALLDDKYQPRLRLEQERIPFDYLLERLA